MKTITKHVVKKEAYGKKLDTPVPFDYTYTAYTEKEEFLTAQDTLSVDEQMKVRNVQRKNKARNAAETAALTAAGITEPTAENDPQVALREMFDTIMARKKHTREQARALAAATLELEWADEDDE